MGDRKRPLEGAPALPPKKFAADYYANQTAQSSTQPEQFLLEKQNRAMALRLQELKAEIFRLTSSAESLTGQVQSGESTIALMTQFWRQLDDDFQLLLARLGTEGDAAAAAAVESAALHDSLLSALVPSAASVDGTASTPDRQGLLEQWRQSMSKTLRVLVQAVERERVRREQSVGILQAAEKGT